LNSLTSYLLITIKGAKDKSWTLKWPVPLIFLLTFVLMLADITDLLAFFTPRQSNSSAGYHKRSKAITIRTINAWIYCIYAVIDEMLKKRQAYQFISLESADTILSIDIR
jgi:hypothetical protein